MSFPAVSCALVVDDDPILVEIASCLLRARKVAEILRAGDGAAALETVARRGRDIQLVLCDLQMPNMDGLAFLRGLTAQRFEGAVVIVSSMNDAVIALASRLARSHGLDVLGTLKKPLNGAKLNAMLDAAQMRNSASRAGSAAILEVEESALRAALEGPQMTVHYQPKIEIATRRIVGAEALARWRSADGSFIAPDRFVPLAERTGLVTALDHRVMAHAVADLVRLQALDAAFCLSVNASADTLDDVHLYDRLVDLLAAHRLAPATLTLEITESQALQRTTSLLEVLGRLRLAGFALAIDDFGTGHSNLEALREFPFTEIKIDRSFVKDALSCGRANASVESCLLLGRQLGMTVVAEGVETADHWQMLERNGTQTAQGYFIAKPMAFEDLVRWMQAPGGLQELDLPTRARPAVA